MHATRPSNALATWPSLHGRSALIVVNVVLRRVWYRECRSIGGPLCERILSITCKKTEKTKNNRRDESAHPEARVV